LIQLWTRGHIELFFADESGFSLKPSVPYGWQPIGQQKGICPKDSERINVLGFMSLDMQLETFFRSKSMDSKFVAQAIEKMIPPEGVFRVLVFDNAPIHRAEELYQRMIEWQEKGLFIFFLPRYSPHLNRIEILWRMIKHHWLKPQDYRSFTTLKKRLTYILENFGEEFRIDFKELNIT